MVQEYRNDSKNVPLETTFYFPVDIDFAMSKIQITYVDLDDPEISTTIETQMEERKKADQIYSDAVASCKQMAVKAQYVTHKMRDLIRVDMGNFPPNSKATLTCHMNTHLKVEDGSSVFRLLMCYVPKYMFPQNEQAT